jgi:hypothetical protein
MNIARLQIAVDHQVLMQIIYGRANSPEEPQPVPRGQPILRAPGIEWRAIHKLHREVRVVIRCRARIQKARVKLLDFGIAKLLSGSQTTTADTTTALMTPGYASPEQVRGLPTSTLTDVWGLGVLLYELLPGVRPFAAPRGELHEALRRICDEEPRPPGIDGELDNIVLKAIRKEPERRYASVEQLDEDLRRYLDGLPVLAQGDSVVYRARKFAGRHKAGIAVAAGMVLLLVGRHPRHHLRGKGRAAGTDTRRDTCAGRRVGQSAGGKPENASRRASGRGKAGTRKRRTQAGRVAESGARRRGDLRFYNELRAGAGRRGSDRPNGARFAGDSAERRDPRASNRGVVGSVVQRRAEWCARARSGLARAWRLEGDGIHAR